MAFDDNLRSFVVKICEKCVVGGWGWGLLVLYGMVWDGGWGGRAVCLPHALSFLSIRLFLSGLLNVYNLVVDPHRLSTCLVAHGTFGIGLANNAIGAFQTEQVMSARYKCSHNLTLETHHTFA